MWLITAWQLISPEVTSKDFKKYFISNALQETDDNMLCNNSEEEGVVSECKEDEGTDCEDGEGDTVR